MRAFARRRPDVDVAVLRFTNFIGPRIDSLLTGFFRMPVVPTALGYDARVQLLHEDDALAVLTRATTGDFVGTVNVGGEGTLLLSQAIRRLGRRRGAAALARRWARSAGCSRRFGFVDYSPEQMRFLNFGRVVDTTRAARGVRLHAALHDARPRWPTTRARVPPVVSPRLVAVGDRRRVRSVPRAAPATPRPRSASGCARRRRRPGLRAVRDA